MIAGLRQAVRALAPATHRLNSAVAETRSSVGDIDFRSRYACCAQSVHGGGHARGGSLHRRRVGCVDEPQLGLTKLLVGGANACEQQRRVQVLLLNVAHRGSHAVQRVVGNEQWRHQDGGHRDERQREARAKRHVSATGDRTVHVHER